MKVYVDINHNRLTKKEWFENLRLYLTNVTLLDLC